MMHGSATYENYEELSQPMSQTAGTSNAMVPYNPPFHHSPERYRSRPHCQHEPSGPSAPSAPKKVRVQRMHTPDSEHGYNLRSKKNKDKSPKEMSPKQGGLNFLNNLFGGEVSYAEALLTYGDEPVGFQDAICGSDARNWVKA